MTVVGENAREQMMRLLSGALVTQMLAVVAELGVADVATEQARPVSELAEAVGADGNALYRVLRALASLGVFTETTPGAFALTPLAATLRSDAPGSVRNWARMWGLAGRQQVLAELGHSVRYGGPVASHALGSDWWSYLRAHPDQAAIFDAAMGDIARDYPARALEACDLDGVHTLVDVGGGAGHLITAALPRYPQMRAVLFDQPHVLSAAPPVLGAAGVAERVEMIAGDFFHEVPAGGDLYLLSMITHDWGDEDVRRILTNMRAAMSASARLILLDAVLPPGDLAHRGKLIDIVMLALHPGRERTRMEFDALLTDTGFRLHEVQLPTAPIAALIALPV